VVGVKLRLFGKPGCHLCEAAEAELRRWPHELEVVDISNDQHLVAEYGLRIPVLLVGKDEYEAPLTHEVIARALRGRG